MTWAGAWAWFGGVPVRVVVTILGAVVLRWLLHRTISTAVAVAVDHRDRRTLTGRIGPAGQRHQQRMLTLGALLRSIVTFGVSLIAILTVMALVSIPLAPLLASAGVGGVALGFGAQSLVKDFLSGIFMIVEDQYGVGDVVDLGDAVGTVEDVSLRVTSLRDASGVLWFIRNGEVVRVANRSQGWAVANADFPVAYDADLESALSALRVMVTQIHEQPPWGEKLVEVPQVVGVESITGTSMVLRVTARCVAGTQIDVQRELRLRGKEALDRAGIPGPALPSGMFGPGSQRPGESAGAGI